MFKFLPNPFVQTLRETWQSDMVKKLEKMYEMRTKTSRARKAYANKGTEDGMSLSTIYLFNIYIYESSSLEISQNE